MTSSFFYLEIKNITLAYISSIILYMLVKYRPYYYYRLIFTMVNTLAKCRKCSKTTKYCSHSYTPWSLITVLPQPIFFQESFQPIDCSYQLLKFFHFFLVREKPETESCCYV